MIRPAAPPVAHPVGAHHDDDVDSSNLTRRQADRLRNDVARQLVYLNKLCARIQSLRWPADDFLGREAVRARNAVQALYIATQGVGQTPSDPLRGE